MRRHKVILAISFISVLLVTWMSLTAVQNNAEKCKNDIGEKLILFSKVAVIPGGDSKPDEQPWTLPTVFVHENDRNFTEFLQAASPTTFLTTNFFLSPGLGNLMFLYTSLYAICMENNRRLVMPRGSLLRRSFYLNTDDVIVSDRLAQYLMKQWKRQVFHDCCIFHSEALNLSTKEENTVVLGYFQSFKYFHNYKIEIKSKFKFLDDIEHLAQSRIEEVLENSGKKRKNTILVGVHVRRGVDLSWNTRNKIHGHTVAPKSYFYKAMDVFRIKFNNKTHDVLFLIVSDDPYWCKQNLLLKTNGKFGEVSRTNKSISDMYNSEKNVRNKKRRGIDDVVVVATGQKTREVDLAILAYCQHTIMSTGTFSWWAAYLAGGQAIYYEYWPRPGSRLASMLNMDDYFLPHWKALM